MSNNEISKGIERAGLTSRSGVADWMKSWDVLWTCEKWSQDACDFVAKKLALDPNTISSVLLRKHVGTPDLATDYVEGNVLLNAGITRLLNLLVGAAGGSPQAYDTTHSRMGVGNDSTAAVASQTDLIAAAGGSNRQFVVMNNTFPGTTATQTQTWQSDFTSGLANFHWQEWGIDLGTTNGTTVVVPLLNRKAEDLGTKTTGTWTLSGAITIA